MGGSGWARGFLFLAWLRGCGCAAGWLVPGRPLAGARGCVLPWGPPGWPRVVLSACAGAWCRLVGARSCAGGVWAAPSML